jgi:hypothetical protein
MAALLGLVAQDLVTRATGPQLGRWQEQVAATGYCAHPIRLTGRTMHVDRATGEVREVYDTADEPDAVLLTACGNRRESRCPSCAATYRADAYQLVRAGLDGGKGVPDTIAGHPRLFVTFTAPGFGPVHTCRERRGKRRPCRPRDRDKRCPHGRPAGCWVRHRPDDPVLGSPICLDCFDAEALVLWNALAPELWRRTTIYLRRALAAAAGITPAALHRTVRVAFVKVAEYQARGAIHFHAVIRLDAAPPKADPEQVASPPAAFTADLLAQAVKAAAAQATVTCPAVGDAPPRLVRWGAQLDLRQIRQAGPGELSAEAVAGYIAKYATKATESYGSALDRRIHYEHELDHLRVPAHIARLARACWTLGGEPALTGLRLRQWAHMLGFRGHWSTKSRRYSTTLTALRRARAAHAEARRRNGATPLDAWKRPMTDQAVVVVKEWGYAGTGYRTVGDALLAASAAGRARERRRIAREELTSMAAPDLICLPA